MKTKQLAGAQDKLLSGIMSEMDIIKEGKNIYNFIGQLIPNSSENY